MGKPQHGKHERGSAMTDLFSQKDRTPVPLLASQNEAHSPALRPDGHACAVCGAPAWFGFGVKLLEGRPGRWSCHAHRQAVQNAAPR
jgi:hypothetical protein